MKFPVELGHVMLFARAVGDPNRIYYDDEYAAGVEPGHLIAPPTFVRASAQFDPNFPGRPTLGEPWLGSGRESSGTAQVGSGGTGLHAEQHFQYHRDVRPGDVLTVSKRDGKSWEREGRRGGILHFYETIFEHRSEDGELVVTERSILVRTSRPVTSV